MSNLGFLGSIRYANQTWWGAGIACWLERPTRNRKVVSLNPAGAAEEFSSPESTLCADSYSVSVPHPVSPQWHVKDFGHSAKSAGGSLHLNTHTSFYPTKSEWVDYVAVQV